MDIVNEYFNSVEEKSQNKKEISFTEVVGDLR